MDYPASLATMDAAITIFPPLVYHVDDSADFRLLVRQVFQRSLPQYLVEYFESGVALCEQLATGSLAVPRLLVLDGQMPGLTGPQTLRALRQHPAWHHVPVVILSSRDSAPDEGEALAAGAVEYVIKPLTLDKLTQLLARLCGHWAAD